MDISRLPRFYKLSVDQRVRVMRERGLLTKEDFLSLSNGDHTLKIEHADKMIENVIGVLGLPVGLGLNFQVNEKDYVVPMAVEEPSIVAAVSSAAKIIRNAGGFTAESTDPILIGQVQPRSASVSPAARRSSGRWPSTMSPHVAWPRPGAV